MVRRLVVIGVVLVGLVSFRAFQVMSNAGEFSPVPPRAVAGQLANPALMFDGVCERDPALGGVRDIAINWDAEELYLVKAGEVHSASLRPDEAGPTAISVAFEGVAVDAVDLATTPDFGDHLYGALVDETGQVSLVLPAAGETPARALSLDIPASANAHVSIAAIDETSAYIAIADAPATTMPAMMLGRHRAHNGALYRVTTDGQATQMARRLRTPLSMDYDPQTQRVFVAEAGARAITIWTPSEDAAPTLVRQDIAPIFNTPGWIALDPENRLWLVTHPKAVSWMTGRTPSPTQVGFLDLDAERGDQVYLETGGVNLSAGLAAHVDPAAGAMVIVGPDAHGLRCALPETWKHSEAYPLRKPQSGD